MVKQIDYLAGHIPEPIRKDELLAAARKLGVPFTLGEIVVATGLPTPVCHRILTRCVKQGIFTRRKMVKTFPSITGGQNGGLVRWLAGNAKRSVYLYSLVKGR